jgi:hypothetical protein
MQHEVYYKHSLQSKGNSSLYITSLPPLVAPLLLVVCAKMGAVVYLRMTGAVLFQPHTDRDSCQWEKKKTTREKRVRGSKRKVSLCFHRRFPVFLSSATNQNVYLRRRTNAQIIKKLSMPYASHHDEMFYHYNTNKSNMAEMQSSNT